MSPLLRTRLSALSRYRTTPAAFAPILGWWKADSFSLANNTDIGGAGNTWIDQSGNGRHLSQATAGNQPTYKTNQIGSMPGIDFGSGDFMSFTAATLAADFTIICVYKQAAANDGLVLGNVSVNRQVRANRSGANQNSFFDGTNEFISSTFGGAQTDTKCVFVRRSTTNISHVENKTARGSTSQSVLSVALDTVGKGTFGPYVGLILEMALYSRNLTTAEAAYLYDFYFKIRWGLP